MQPLTAEDFIWAIVGTSATVGIVILFEFMRYRSGNYKSLWLRFIWLKKTYRNCLQRYFYFYQILPAASKKKFERRVQHFINMKQFHKRGGLEITDEMKALVAATAVQLTFGLPGVFLSHFNKILLYPEDYYSTISQHYHKGEVNPRSKLIVLSWKAFKEGIIDHQDGRNLGLHEMAHALHLENNIFNKEYRFFSPDLLNEWRQEMHMIQSGYRLQEQPVFRAYAFTDEHEFFAVSVEVFFENPFGMQKHHQKLYQILARLLKQDPAKLYTEHDAVA